MKRQKEQWQPRVVNLRKQIVDGREEWVEFDPAETVIPAGHPVYNVLAGIARERIEKGA